MKHIHIHRHHHIIIKGTLGRERTFAIRISDTLSALQRWITMGHLDPPPLLTSGPSLASVQASQSHLHPTQQAGPLEAGAATPFAFGKWIRAGEIHQQWGRKSASNRLLDRSEQLALYWGRAPNTGGLLGKPHKMRRGNLLVRLRSWIGEVRVEVHFSKAPAPWPLPAGFHGDCDLQGYFLRLSGVNLSSFQFCSNFLSDFLFDPLVIWNALFNFHIFINSSNFPLYWFLLSFPYGQRT